MRKFFALLLILTLLDGCSYFENPNKKAPVQVVDTVVDFNTVDAFPLFPKCKDIPSRQKQQICFQMEMAQHIYASLKVYELQTRINLMDTVFVKLKVDTSGTTTLAGLKISEETAEILPEFDSILKVSLTELPKLEPAIKRAMPVATEFTLPIVLKN
jgi:hypothetical protein